MKTIIVNKFSNTTLYQFETEKGFVSSETERIRDKKGTLLRNHTSFGFFECYSMAELKNFIIKNN